MELLSFLIIAEHLSSPTPASYKSRDVSRVFINHAKPGPNIETLVLAVRHREETTQMLNSSLSSVLSLHVNSGIFSGARDIKAHFVRCYEKRCLV